MCGRDPGLAVATGSSLPCGAGGGSESVLTPRSTCFVPLFGKQCPMVSAAPRLTGLGLLRCGL